MNKLQLYITKSGNVYKSLFNLNPDEDVRRYITDLRQAVELIEYDCEEKNIFYYLTATNDGIFFTIIRTIPPRRGAHLAAWIYIPHGTCVTDKTLLDLVNLTTRKVSNAEVSNEDVAHLREAFAREYAVDAGMPAITGCSGTEYAWRTYGDTSGLTLKDYTGRGLWQQSYIPYAGILLVDDMLGYEVKAESLDNTPLGQPATILVPEASPEGFRPYVFNRALDRPLAATLDAEIALTWRRPGFEDVVEFEIINSPDFMPHTVSTEGALKTVTPDSFFITSQSTRQPLEGCFIRVNGHEITRDGRQFNTEELRHANVSVSCEGHFPFSGQLDLASTKRALIQLQERRKIYRFELPLTSSDFGGPVSFELQSKNEIDSSPIEGYVLLDEIQEGAARTNHLGYARGGTSTSSKIIWTAVGFAAGILLMLLINLLTGGNGNKSTLAPAANPDSIVAPPVPEAQVPPTPAIETPAITQPAKPAQPEEPKTEPQQQPAASQPDNNLTVQDAVTYLDSNLKWNRDELEKNPATKGLYDDLNTFNTARVNDLWLPKLKDSKRLQKVAHHLKEGDRKKKRKLPETYNKPGDHVIAVQSYLNKVDP